MAGADLLTLTPQGLYCPAGDFHIDPWRPVPRALVTHGHSDHARPGMGAYLTTPQALPVIRHRLGPVSADTLPYGQTLRIGAATVSFHPAGHVPGSAQIRVEHRGEVWVVSGDYKTEADGLAEAFAPVPCHCFITECTFGLPVFRWAPQADEVARIAAWWAANAAEGRTSLLAAYSFGKAQRLLAALPPLGPILTHGAVEEVTAILRAQGYPLPPTIRVTPGISGKTHPGALVIAPPSALASAWARRFEPAEEAMASGWMAVRGIRRRRGLERGFALSDHADWDGLNAAVAATGASRVLATHGYTDAFARWLGERGLNAAPLRTEFGGEGEEPGPATEGRQGNAGPETGEPAPPDHPRNAHLELAPDLPPDPASVSASAADPVPAVAPNATPTPAPDAPRPRTAPTTPPRAVTGIPPEDAS